jgi:hypothetical protein
MGLKQSQTLEFTFNIKYLFGFMTYEIPVLTFKIKSNKSCKFICNKIQTLFGSTKYIKRSEESFIP